LTVPKLLIDGYNLLFESDLVGRGRGPHWLPKARERMLKTLNQHLEQALLTETLIVFDAPKVGPAPDPMVQPSGLKVVYAVDHEEADDLLEKIIRNHPTPKLLTVISSDQRIRRAARTRRACSVGSQDFLDSLSKLPRQIALEPIGKPASPSLSESEVAYWLEKFSDRGLNER
jgi:uncharacterized protein